MTATIIIGNIIALIASLLMVYTGIVKNKGRILYIQTIQIGLSVISNVVLGGITGAIINALNLIRNILFNKGKLNMKAKVIITILSIVLSVLFNNLAIIGLLPLISAISYLWLMDTKNIIKFKLLIIFSLLLWLIYDLVVHNYVASAFDFGSIVANIISIIQIRMWRKESKIDK